MGIQKTKLKVKKKVDIDYFKEAFLPSPILVQPTN